MKIFTCFKRQSKSRLPVNALLGLLIVAVIALACNQAARSFAYYLYTNGSNECALLDISPASGYSTCTARPVKNNAGKNHGPSSQYCTEASQVFRAHVQSPYPFVAGCACFINFSWRQSHYTYFFQDLPPPLSS